MAGRGRVDFYRRSVAGETAEVVFRIAIAASKCINAITKDRCIVPIAKADTDHANTENVSIVPGVGPARAGSLRPAIESCHKTIRRIHDMRRICTFLEGPN